MRDMRDKMIQLEKNTIDVGRNPGKAIEQISNPLLDQLQEQVISIHQPSLEENMLDKGKLERQETDMNSQIYDHQIRQLFIKQTIRDQGFLLEDMKQDLVNMREQIEAKRDRKQIL